jgi:hypothetical protein
MPEIMRKFSLIILFFIVGMKGYSQITSVKGNICDENGTPIGYAPVVLLNPSDSTLLYFGVTNDKGYFEMKGVKEGSYLFQAAYIGHNTVYRPLQFPLSGDGDIGAVVMKSKPVALGEVIVSEERVPLQFKRDTIE